MAFGHHGLGGCGCCDNGGSGGDDPPICTSSTHPLGPISGTGEFNGFPNKGFLRTEDPHWSTFTMQFLTRFMNSAFIEFGGVDLKIENSPTFAPGKITVRHPDIPHTIIGDQWFPGEAIELKVTRNDPLSQFSDDYTFDVKHKDQTIYSGSNSGGTINGWTAICAAQWGIAFCFVLGGTCYPASMENLYVEIT